MKPSSIARFEQLYWASVIVGLVYSWLTWSDRATMLAANPVLAQMPWFMPLATALGLVIAVLLWFFIVRRPSVVAKWIVVVFAVLDAIGVVLSVVALLRGGVAAPVAVALSLIGNILYIVAASMLFRPDARAWLGERVGGATDETPLA